MGNYAHCWLGDFYVGSTKNDVDPGLMGLFGHSDKHIVTDPRALVPQQLTHWVSERDQDDELCLVYYEAPLRVVRDRLDLLGYTLDTSREAFEEYIEREREQYERRSTEAADGSGPQFSEFIREYSRAKLSLLRDLTVDTWLAGLDEIRRSGLRPNRYGRYEGTHEGTLLGHLLTEGWNGFPGPDLLVALRLAIEVCPDAQELMYDLTDLVLSEYALPDEDFVESSRTFFADEYQSSAKIILLTEGKTDSAILSAALELLFPHLARYYSFMEFDALRVGGGAGNLVNLVKAFAGAGIANRTIALFDNDTAAAAALKSLDKVSLPPHIRVLRLPSLELLRAYPTIGPSGTMSLDVNGVAGSIELYLGEDVLRSGADLVPVQWTGYDSGLRRYQGEVLDKDELHERFFRKVEAAKLDQSKQAGQHWSGVRAILAAVFAAFHEFDREHICGLARRCCCDPE
jgi:HEPN/Toprim N-terminal domain 1